MSGLYDDDVVIDNNIQKKRTIKSNSQRSKQRKQSIKPTSSSMVDDTDDSDNEPEETTKSIILSKKTMRSSKSSTKPADQIINVLEEKKSKSKKTTIDNKLEKIEEPIYSSASSSSSSNLDDDGITVSNQNDQRVLELKPSLFDSTTDDQYIYETMPNSALCLLSWRDYFQLMENFDNVSIFMNKESRFVVAKSNLKTHVDFKSYPLKRFAEHGILFNFTRTQTEPYCITINRSQLEYDWKNDNFIDHLNVYKKECNYSTSTIKNVFMIIVCTNKKVAEILFQKFIKSIPSRQLQNLSQWSSHLTQIN